MRAALQEKKVREHVGRGEAGKQGSRKIGWGNHCRTEKIWGDDLRGGVWGMICLLEVSKGAGEKTTEQSHILGGPSVLKETQNRCEGSQAR